MATTASSATGARTWRGRSRSWSSTPPTPSRATRPPSRRSGASSSSTPASAEVSMRVAGRLLLAFALVAALGWGALALHYGGAPSRTRDALALGYVLAGAGLLWPGRHQPAARLGVAALFAAVLAWWLALAPRNDRDWQPDVAVLPRIDVAGDTLAVHGVRNNEYRSEHDYTARFEDRTYSLAGLRTLDLFLVYWGSPW